MLLPCLYDYTLSFSKANEFPKNTNKAIMASYFSTRTKTSAYIILLCVKLNLQPFNKYEKDKRILLILTFRL